MDTLALAIEEPVRRRLQPVAQRPALSPRKLMAELAELPFSEAADLLRLLAAHSLAEGLNEQTIALLRETVELLQRADSATMSLRALSDLQAALLATLAEVHFEAAEPEEASATAASALTILTQEPRRKDEPFLATLGSLLYTIARFHELTHRYRQAEREVEKAMRVFERLARLRPMRYTPALLTLQQAAAEVCGHRAGQLAMIERCRATAADCQERLESGQCAGPEARAALLSLVDALHGEGSTLASMGRHRQAVQYYTRALRYLTRLPEADTDTDVERRQMRMSVDLGESLVNIAATRAKGVHLLNTLLQKVGRTAADEAEAVEQTRRIRALLDENASRRLAILDVWQKIFPK